MADMFCFQCQEALGNVGCTKVGVCGKKPEVAAAQDLLIWVSKGLSAVTTRLREEGKKVDTATNHIVTGNLFTTITNANFDVEAINARIELTIAETQRVMQELDNKDGLPMAATFSSQNLADWAELAELTSVLATENEDVRSLRELIIYGLKGLAAYVKHANVLKAENEEVDAFIQEALAKTLDNSLSVDELVALTLATGANGVKGMALLDGANTSTYGNPEITEVNIGVRSNPGILISGHDLRDLQMLLEQTEGTGVDVYTHSEMLPAQYYPAFKKYDHFAGNYGNAWWKQREEFDAFNGPILMTTNCIVPPRDTYKDKLFKIGRASCRERV